MYIGQKPKGVSMIATMRHRQIDRRRREGMGRSPAPPALARQILLAAGFLCTFAFMAPAQDLNNSGQINNTGTIRVRNQATGLPPVVDGMFEYFGSNQPVPARQYRDLMLTGSGTKSSTGGNFSVSGNITVSPTVVFGIEPGASVTLIGNLDEQGYLSGSIGKTVNLSGGTALSNFGNIGATISWTGTAPGQTTVTRVSGTASTGNGNQSILRYYDVAPTFGANLNGTLTFEYDPVELNGQDPNTLELWRSPDGGVTWRRQTGTSLPGLNSIVKSGIVGFSRWTAADPANLLGPAQYEWVASSLASISGSGQNGPAGSVLAPFIVTVMDFFGNPIAGTNVTFVVDSIPAGATGYSLSVANVVTNASGQASTILTLGNGPGLYRVRASGGGLTGSPQTFTATVTSSIASMGSISGSNQVDTILTTLSPISLEVLDTFGNPVPGVTVNFAITGRPAGETGSGLTASSVTSDGLGRAVTTLRLGNKVGTYQVTATTPSLPAAQVQFNATALPGAAVLLSAQNGITTQQDTILQALDTLFTVRIMDSGANPVPGVPVSFGITSTPVSATGQVLSASNATTDANGVAATRLTLGSKIGPYEVTASSASLAPLLFNAQALTGSPALLAETAGSGQQKSVTTTLDTAFTARITDIGGNPIQGLPVQFAIHSVPGGAVGASLSTTADTTDSNGEASTVFTLGTRSGAYEILARASALPGDSTTFTVQALAGAAAQMLATSGGGQIQPAAVTLPMPFTVTVTDAFGNLVPGTTVLFAVTSVPAGAIGHQVNPATAITDAAGQAQSVLRLGSLPGDYITTVTVSGVPSAQFTATASFIVADVNNDFDVNIADLTSIIDHILERRVLTGMDSAKGDVNRDGAINVLDVVVLQNSLLGTVSLPKGIRPAASEISGRAESALAPNVSGTLEITPLGTRLNLTNDVPIKGIQLVIALNTSASVNRTDVVFPRARDMQFFVNSNGAEVRLVAYNLQNAPIDTGSGSIVRLPMMLTDTTDVDSVYAIISTSDTTFDIAVRIPVSTIQNVYPAAFRLYQNYPNPFNAGTVIQFEVPDVQGKFVRTLVQVFNLLGEKVKTLARGEHTAGQYRVTWDGTDDAGNKAPTGVYFYRLVSGDYVSAKRMVMIK